MPKACSSLWRRMLWSMVSNAALRSRGVRRDGVTQWCCALFEYYNWRPYRVTRFNGHPRTRCCWRGVIVVTGTARQRSPEVRFRLVDRWAGLDKKTCFFDVESVSNFQSSHCHRLMRLDGGGTTNRDGEIIMEIRRDSIWGSLVKYCPSFL